MASAAAAVCRLFPLTSGGMRCGMAAASPHWPSRSMIDTFHPDRPSIRSQGLGCSQREASKPRASFVSPLMSDRDWVRCGWSAYRDTVAAGRHHESPLRPFQSRVSPQPPPVCWRTIAGATLGASTIQEQTRPDLDGTARGRPGGPIGPTYHPKRLPRCGHRIDRRRLQRSDLFPHRTRVPPTIPWVLTSPPQVRVLPGELEAPEARPLSVGFSDTPCRPR
jgi:hypothetical protein